MDEFLANTVSKLKSKDYSSVTVVLGNESCDLDSAVSSLVYAMFLHWQYQQIQCGVSELFVPLLDVHHQHYELKTEVAYSLGQAGLLKDHLVFRDDIDLHEIAQTTNLKIILVDHHNMSNRFASLAPYVTEIIDHRPLDRTGWKYKDDTKSTIEVVGSCCTLVAQRIKDLSMLLSKGVTFFTEYPLCARLLYSVILLDTVNFSKEVNKATPLDEEMVMFLETLIKPIDYVQERQSIVDRLVAARSDVSNLTASQLLKKDVKIIGDILVPSFPILVEEFLSKPGAVPAVGEALSQQHCSMALLLGMKLGSQLQRDVAIITINDPVLAESLSQDLQAWTRPPLQLVPLHRTECIYFRQENISASRKQYLPAISQFLERRKNLVS